MIIKLENIVEQHNKCNLLYQEPQHIPVILYNLSGYDAHLFIKNLGKTPGR